MKNRFHYPWQAVRLLRSVCLLILLLFELGLSAYSLPDHEDTFDKGKMTLNSPVFLDPVPADTSVLCVQDVPAPVSLTAEVDDPDNPVEIAPVDNPDPMSIDSCTGGIVTRTWTAVDMNDDTTSVSQIITVLPDTDPPFVNIPEPEDIFPCDAANFEAWVNGKNLQLATSMDVGDNCYTGIAGIDNIVNDAPASFDEPCGSITVTFTISDNCGLSTDWQASFTTVDTEGPELIDLPADITLSCQNPIPDPPMVTALDNCTDPLTPSFNQVNTQLLDGSCSEYEYTITRTWTVSDSCGNQTAATQIITVLDETAPNFIVPDDVTISCEADPNDLSVTGNVTGVNDNCDPNVNVFYTDSVTEGDCPQESLIIRIWRARDTCGNVTGKVQNITIADVEAPTFSVPEDITVSCEEANDLDLTGEPTDLADNCSVDLLVTFSDVFIAGPCENTYTLRRTWRVADDCGQFTELDQFVTVVDEDAPVFTQAAQNFSISCNTGIDPEQAFSDWVSSRAGAMATDNCSLEEDLEWFTFNAGTSDAVSLTAISCPAPGAILVSQAVDFIVEDECGNRDTTTAVFSLVDETPPVVSNCPADVTITTDPGLCEAAFVLQTPQIEEACATLFLPENITEIQTITAQGQVINETDIPVDPMEYNLAVSNPLPINAVGDASLSVRLMSADIEQPSEYLNVYGEDGSYLGRTAISGTAPQSCVSSDTTLTVTEAQINSWAADGIITIRLEPNIPANQPGTFAVNAVCATPGTARLNLHFTVKDLSAIVYEYSINSGARIEVDPIDQTGVSLPLGSHLIKYFATDCAGNSDSCAYTVTVQDEEPPVLNCPPDQLVSLEPGACIASVTLPFPGGVTDNCTVGEVFEMRLPGDTTQAYFNFSFDPNLNDYLPAEKTFLFTGVAANAFNTVVLTLDLQGDFNTDGAFLRIFGDDDSLLGTTSIGVASCTSPGQTNFLIPAATFNQWAADGEIVIRAVPNPIPIPPGGPGDGINACNTPVIDGGIDSLSYIFASLAYTELAVSYFGAGATNIPVTQMAPPVIAPTHDFNLGVTEISYIVQDAFGNLDTCSFDVIVEDNELPTPLCQPTTLFINPSGFDVQTVSASELDAGSFDNCGIDTMYITPNIFNCQQAGSNINVTLTVIDLAGNVASCDTLVRIEKEEPMPTANSGLCGGDSLFLFANPPPASGGVIYTYRWSGPGGGLLSTQQNPVIANIDEDDAGPYIVEVTGITGCTSTGTVQVNIEDLPLTPVLLTDMQICTDEALVLNSSIFPSGANVTFRWYRGLPPNGLLIGTTSEQTLTVPGPHPLGTTNYYLTVEADGCLSAPSPAVAVQASLKPSALVSFSDTTICAGETINLGTPVMGPGISYSWSGPASFTSSAQFPQLGPATALNEGFYTLVITRNGCASEEANIQVSVLPKPATPNISNNGPVCAGQTIVLSTTTTGAGTYHWFSVDDQQEFVTTTNTRVIPNTTINDSGQWYLYVIKQGCRSDNSSLTNVMVNQVPTANASASPAVVCEGATLNLNVSTNVPMSDLSWSGPNGFGSVSASPVIQNVGQNAEGTYEVMVTTQQGCSASGSVSVNVLDRVEVVSITSDAPDCLNGPTDIELCSTVFPLDNGNYTYEWKYMGQIVSTESCALIPTATQADNGAYTLVVYTAEGCPSQMEQFILDVTDAPATPPQPTISASTPPPFCVGETIQLVTLPYNGNNVTYYWQKPNGGGIETTNIPSLQISGADMSSGGNYSVRVEVDGCTSGTSAPLSIQVNPIPQITASSNSPVCRGQVLELSTQATGGTFTWFGPNNFSSSMQSPAVNTSNANILGGLYKVITTVNGCKSDTAFAEVVINPSPALPLALNDGPHCISDPAAILQLSVNPSSATNGAEYTWYGPDFEAVGGPTSGLNFNLTDFEDFNEDGAYSFYVRAQLGDCLSAFSPATQVTLNTIPDIQAFAGDDFSACQGSAISLNAEAPATGTGRWALVAGNPAGVTIANPNMAVTSVNGLTGGQTYTFRWTLSNGACTNYSSDEVAVMVTAAEQSFAGDNILACAFDEITLDALAPVDSTSTGMWSQPEVQEVLGVDIVDPSDPNTLITGLQPDNLYTFTWTIISGCGAVTDDVFVIISDPKPDAGDDVIACNDAGNAELEAVEPTTGSAGMWSSPDAMITIDDPLDIATTVHNLAPGPNLFVWTIDDAFCGATSRDTVVVFYKMDPVAEPDEVTVGFQQRTDFIVLDNDFTPPNSVVTIINGPIRGGTIEATGNGQFAYTPPLNFVGVDELTYELCSEGCDCSTAKVTFFVGDGVQCKAPSVITPNNDGINDAFVIPCLLDQDRFPASQVIIFNRWGDEVYRSPQPYRNDWAGTFDGEQLPPGTYFYIITYGDGQDPEDGYLLIQP